MSISLTRTTFSIWKSLARQVSTVLRALQEKKDLQAINQLANRISQETTVEGVLRTCVEDMPVALGSIAL